MSKYRAQKVTVNGETFDSKGEYERWCQLKLLERARVILSLSRQPKFVLCVNGQEVCAYHGDYAYFENGRQVIEDYKGVMTPAFRIKRKLFLALYPNLELRVTNRKGEVLKVKTRRSSKQAA